MYYHVVIKTYSDTTNVEKQLNLSEEQLRNQFVEPYENNFSIFINGKVININDIQTILFFSSFLQKKELKFPGTQKGSSVLHDLDLTNVTSLFIKWAPGYQKKNTYEKILKPGNKNNQIFVVHGHDEEMKQSVARIIEKLGLKPIILHEQPHQGRTIIEKFTEYADGVSFAVVLLSPDDKGYKKDRSSEAAKFRARQNVILELGFFLGKLGRNNVVALFKNESNFELPSDYDGVLYTPFDNSGRWQFDLVRELKSAGYDVDANKLVC